MLAQLTSGARHRLEENIAATGIQFTLDDLREIDRAAQMTAFRRPMEVGEVPVDVPRPDGAVVRAEACGVCRSDWHFWNQDLDWIGFNLSLPAMLGHEVGGVVEEIGRAVRDQMSVTTWPSPSTKPTVGAPEWRTWYQNLCDHMTAPPVHRRGGWGARPHRHRGGRVRDRLRGVIHEYALAA